MGGCLFRAKAEDRFGPRKVKGVCFAWVLQKTGKLLSKLAGFL